MQYDLISEKKRTQLSKSGAPAQMRPVWCVYPAGQQGILVKWHSVPGQQVLNMFGNIFQ